MRIERTIASVRPAPGDGRRRVFVPTMGALHRGHGELIRIARQAAGKDGEVAVSIFVNPLQFAPGGDYEKYPRPEKEDDDFCREAGVDVLFRPSVEEMYAGDFSVAVEESSLSNTLCGRSRPGHFRGVCTVVAKLFHIVAPDAAVFGEKDFQQLAIIRRMVRDLNFSVEIIGAATVREPDGLACSSRNQYLSADEREEAPVLQRALQEARRLTSAGERSASVILEAARGVIASARLARIDYLEVVNAETLQPVSSVGPDSLFFMAERDTQLWRGLTAEAQKAVETRDYTSLSFADRLAGVGIEGGKLASANRNDPDVAEGWIPGVEIFSRIIYHQRYRGVFGEFARRDEGPLARIGFWPAQWATSRMFAQTAKGFHVHPPSIPNGTEPADWMRRLFIDEPENYSLRRYADEQWDVMFFVQGVAEMILREARAGLPTRTMRFFIDGDNHPGANNVGIVVPAGVAHAIRVEGSEDVIMVYGTSTSFKPEFEGRIASEVETAVLPESWSRFLAK